MAFDTYEKSRHEGSRFELYKFETDDNRNIWTYTTDKFPFDFDLRTYEPKIVQRSAVEQNSAEGSGQRLTIKVPYDLPVAALHVPYLPPRPVKVTIYAVHRRDAVLEVKQCFVGEITSFSQRGPIVEFQCSHIIDSQQQRVPWQVHKQGCVWAVYEDGCGVLRALFQTTVTSFVEEGADLVSASFSGHPDPDWFRGGRITNADTGEERFITQHVGDRITLVYPFIDLQPDATLLAYAGCDLKPGTCSGKFNNKPNYLGFDFPPTYNVFDGGVR